MFGGEGVAVLLYLTDFFVVLDAFLPLFFRLYMDIKRLFPVADARRERMRKRKREKRREAERERAAERGLAERGAPEGGYGSQDSPLYQWRMFNGCSVLTVKYANYI